MSLYLFELFSYTVTFIHCMKFIHSKIQPYFMYLVHSFSLLYKIPAGEHTRFCLISQEWTFEFLLGICYCEQCCYEHIVLFCYKFTSAFFGLFESIGKSRFVESWGM